MTYTLINAPPSPYGRKVAIALIEKQLTYEVVYDLPWGEGTCTPEYSPLEQLPILVCPDGKRVYDSTYILEWLERRHPSPALVPGGTDDFLFTKLLQTLGERLMEIAQSVVFELQHPQTSQTWIERQSRKIRGGLAELDRLIGSRRVDSNDLLTVGDIAIGTTLLIWEYMVEAGFSPDHEEFHWRGQYPNLTPYMTVLEQRPSFVATRPKMMDVDLKAAVR